jgi:hypothetical protein
MNGYRTIGTNLNIVTTPPIALAEEPRMENAEIILNLWYIHDDTGIIYSLRARAYVGTGTDDEKLTMLDRLANVDYLIARPFPIPERFHIEIEEDGKRRRMPVAPRVFERTRQSHCLVGGCDQAARGRAACSNVLARSRGAHILLDRPPDG